MALEKQLVPMSLAQGLDNKTDEKQVIAGKFLTLENAVFETIKKFRLRNGYEAYPTTVYNPLTVTNSILGSNVTEGRLVTEFKDEVLINDGYNLYSFSESNDAWAYKGRSTAVSVGQESISTSLNGQTMSDSASNATLGKSIFAWSDPEVGLAYSIIDIETGQVLVNQAVASATGSRARCLSLGSALFLLYLQSNDLYGIRIDSSGAAAPVALLTDLNTTDPNYDAEVSGVGIYVSYNGDASNVKVAVFSGSLTLTASVSKSENASNCISNFADSSGNIWTVYGNTSAIKAFVMDPFLSVTVLAPTTVDSSTEGQDCYNVTGVYAQSKGFIFYEKPGIPSVGDVASVREEGSNFSYVQPAVGATVTVSFPDASTDLIGEIVYVLGEKTDFYRVTAAVANTSYTFENLGYPGGEAPGTTMNAFNASPFFQMLVYATVNSTSYIMVNTLTAAGTVGTAEEFARSVALGSKAFAMDSIPHVIGVHGAALQPTYFLLNLYNTISDPDGLMYANIAAKIAPSSSGSRPELPMLPRVNIDGATAQIALQKRNIFYTAAVAPENPLFAPKVNTYSLTGVISVSLDFSLENPNTELLGENLHIALGQLQMYDGVNVVEHGFHLYPEGVTAEVSSSGGGMAAGTYGYQVMYEWRDAKGQVHRSAPSPVVSATVTSGGSVELRIPTLSLTNKKGVSIVVYRSEANGTIYYRLNAPDAPLANVPNEDFVSYTDTVNDNVIIAGEQIYTLGEVENIAAPAPKFLLSFKNRVLLIPSENPTELWYSKQVVPGYPVEFSDLFVQNLGTEGGEVTAAAVLDDKIVLYRKGYPSYIVGTGPAPSGANNDFTDPIKIASDVGAAIGSTVLVTPTGILFRSGKGMCLLDRSLAVRYMDEFFNGAAVDPYMVYDLKTSTLVGNQNQARLTLSNGEAIVYDYNVGQWSVFTNHAAVSSAIARGGYHYITAAGVVFRETPGEYSDNGSFIKMKFITSWLQGAGIQGYQRAYHCLIVGGYKGPNELSVGISHDFDETVTQTAIAAAISAPDGALQYRVNFDRQKCEAFKLTVETNPVTPVNEGLDISAITFMVGVKKGTNKLPAGKVVS